MKDTMHKNRFPCLICLVGIDGSGKTTLAKVFVEEAKKRGITYKYVWGNAQPIFLRPLRALAHLTFLRSFDMKRDYEQYEKIKEEASSKHVILSWIYGRIFLLDYIIWLFLKVKLPLLFGQKIICDRYVIDVAVNLYFLNKNYFPNIENTIRSLFKYFPKPELLYIVDVPVSVAFARKTDIPSVDFLEKRRAIYQRLGEIFNARKLDGNQSVSELTEIILKEIKERAN